ncbi:GTPase IMAP family member 4-like isoform X2 [Pomacea canaliculata]|uniref:GTPase IMAP family member 4-like isoform X2 n=1 Tax=Pomacea canaliculata TaxID=400727 RepID=UPI000D73A245|nr:GTPase IMAP family member 4-like isoform X2 [Pomacea canaliculata]
MEDLRILLLGRTGCGKSSLGNTLLGSRVFVEQNGINPATNQCQYARQHINGRNVTVVDAPGLRGDRVSEDTVFQEILSTIAIWSPGPHVVVIVLRCNNRFTLEEYASVRTLQRLFGNNIRPFLVIVFTGGDSLGATPDEMRQALERQIAAAGDELRLLLQDVSNRFCVVSNTGSPEERNQHATVVYNMIQSVLTPNNGMYFTNDTIERTTQELEEVIDRLQETHRPESAARFVRRIWGRVINHNITLAIIGAAVVVGSAFSR